MGEFWDWLRTGCHDIKVASLTKFARWSDPKLAPYRTVKQGRAAELTHEGRGDKEKNAAKEPAQEKRREETHKEVRQAQDTNVKPLRSHLRVADIMTPQSAMVYVHDDEVLGPLVLDRLYRSGLQHFPVLNYDLKIIGLIHTAAFNALEIRETSRVVDILDAKVCYLREDYSLEQALAAFVRTGCQIMLVVDRFERVAGLLAYDKLIGTLLGGLPEDDFEQDSNRMAVAKRK